MKTIRSLFREIKVEIWKVAFLYSFLNAATAFLILQLILSFFRIGYLYSLAVAGLTFVASMIHYTDKLGFKQMEEGNPQIKEMLRTANDNIDQGHNILVQGLFLDLAEKMKTVSSGPLMQTSHLFLRIVIISCLTFLIVFMSSFGIMLDITNIPFGQTLFGSEQQGRFSPHLKPNQTIIETLAFNDSDLILGDDSVAKLSNEQINLELTPEMKELDFNKEKDLEDKEFQRNSFPIEVSAQSAETLDNDIPKESELAKAYSLQVKGG